MVALPTRPLSQIEASGTETKKITWFCPIPTFAKSMSVCLYRYGNTETKQTAKVYILWPSHWPRMAAMKKEAASQRAGAEGQSRTVGGVGPHYSDHVRSRTDVASKCESPLPPLTSPVAR